MPLKPKKTSGGWIASSFDDFGASSMPGSSKTKPRKSDEGKPTVASGAKNSGTAWLLGRKADTGELWVDKHQPRTKDDLAVHKKKIAEVEGWLTSVLEQKNNRRGGLALLTGPPGVGKTATIQVLAREMKLDLHEWSNPVTNNTSVNWEKRAPYGYGDFSTFGGYVSESQAAQFQDFLLRANRYNSLQLSDNVTCNKLILVEEFPNVFFKETRQLHDILRLYSKRSQTPLVIILSDSAGGDSNERLLFPADIQAELHMANISFNPVAPTMMSKVLQKIATAEGVTMGRGSSSKAMFEPILNGSSGDIRAAINALQFSCQKGTSGSSKRSSQTAGSQRAKKSKKGEDSGGGSGVVSAIGTKDNSLFLFRALGKILYCKRGDRCDFPAVPPLPPHLAHHERAPLLSDPEDVVERAQLSGGFFMAYLHQNYLDFFTDLDDVVRASEYLSDADYLSCEWVHRSTLQHYAASVATRALMHCNSARAKSSGSGASGLGWKPLHKPAWFGTIRKARLNAQNAKALFREYCWTPEDLLTEFLPYLPLLHYKQTRPGQSQYLHEVCRFGNQGFGLRNYADKLGEKDVDTTNDQDQEDSLTKQGTGDDPDDVQPQLQEEEYKIDDFDD